MSIEKKISIKQLEACLPQTQCTLCNYPGCGPYATAIAHGEADIDRCAPGGVETLEALARLFGKDPQPYREKVATQYRSPQRAFIREEECIGCTKCIQACPVDAIVGAQRQMHTIINDACNGCELCVPVCPVDCITLLPMPSLSSEEKMRWQAQNQTRFTQRQERLLRLDQEAKRRHSEAKLIPSQGQQDTLAARQAAIRAALARKKGGA